MNRFQKEFRKWLQSHESEIVGFRADNSACPLATFASGAANRPLLADHDKSSTARIHSRTRRAFLGAWASTFMIRLDGNGANSVVRGHEALDALEPQ